MIKDDWLGFILFILIFVVLGVCIVGIVWLMMKIISAILHGVC